MYTLVPTDPGWAEAALSDLPALLADHLHCERKAAASALSLVRAYPHRPELVLHLSRLAHEETDHMVQVIRHLRRAGGGATTDTGNQYARGLRAALRAKEPERQLDLLLVSGVIEARSAERLGLVATALRGRDDDLAAFYAELTESEVRHRELFLSLARPLAPPEALAHRLAALCAHEATVIADLPWGPRIH
jgi:tRNA 2-(methylsulfanyl)-N6-isopentenyladenosine37 hydroxylase